MVHDKGERGGWERRVWKSGGRADNSHRLAIKLDRTNRTNVRLGNGCIA